MEAALADFLTELDRADDVDTAWSVTLDHLRSLGIEGAFYAYGPSRAPEEDPDRMVRLTNLPGWWLEHYAASRYKAVDPAIAHCRRAVRPLLTGLEFVEPAADAARIRLFDDSWAAGMRSGVVLPLRLRHGGQRFGGFTCQTRFRRREIEPWFAHVGHALQVSTFYADARMLDLALGARIAPVRLSRRERECLLWLAKGLRNDRIAERLGIAKPTVELHLANARRKLGASTREQALAKAVAFGLVTP